MATRTNPATPPVIWLSMGLVAVSAAALSFASLQHLAVACGVSVALAWLVPVAIDAAAAVASWVWLAPSSPQAARRFARTLAIGTLALSVAGNALDHWLQIFGGQPAWWLVVALAAVPPIVLGAVVHLVALLITDHQATPAATDQEEVVTHQVTTHQGGDNQQPGLGAHQDLADTIAPGTRQPGEQATEPAASHQAHNNELASARRNAPARRQAPKSPGGDERLVAQVVDMLVAGERDGRQVGRGTVRRQLELTSDHQARTLLEAAKARRGRPSLRAVGDDG
ncbi:DUF2637 domain-containing protein [Amycolatopsis palatopharyngis]|uniref:DUF2637 domain-containing protein n=1 Tax=Amycolatopsis palatopharyngis TaxID=187982 RepID=UPI000E275218|nr:DUF2637 domain-containing protein [Amycolatopsis palatopharyngis]